MNKVTPAILKEMKRRNEPIVALTCYDTPTASLLDEAGIDVALVGDSLGNVKLGYKNTLPVTVWEMRHYTQAVKRGNSRALLVSDMPYLSYETDSREAARNAGILIKEGGAEAVKVEGGRRILPAVQTILKANVPVMGHLGLTPQSIHRLGGYRVQGRTKENARELLEDAKALERAGAFAIVLECIPKDLGRRITKAVSIPTIGIGAGRFCDGQILVVDDMLGLSSVPPPKFVKKYASLRAQTLKAVLRYKKDVKTRRYPSVEYSY
jgi:3-methyl-2-oxobutanoate hydroxymethyltransferase